MAPPRLWIDQAFQKGIDKQNFIYYGAEMIKPGPVESVIKTLPGKEETIPNSMIVPIKKGEKAKPGDIILTWWQSGSGMERAIVVKGGTETEPKVLYLDMDLDNPSGCGKKIDQCKPNTFHKLKSAFEPGTVVAIKEGSQYKHGHVAAIAKDKVLVIGFAGFMKVVSKSQCTPIPINPPKLKNGDSVMFPRYGSYAKGTVDKIDPAIGRVFISAPFGGKTAKYAIAYGDVISKLP